MISSHTLSWAPHTRMCFSWRNVCRSTSPFALNWVINHPTPPPFAFRQWACVLFPEPAGLCSLLSQTIYLRGNQVVHIYICVHTYASVFQLRMYVGNVCMRMPPPHSHPAGFFAKINLPVDDCEILQESHPEGVWANTSAMLLYQWAEQMNEQQWERWREKKEVQMAHRERKWEI